MGTGTEVGVQTCRLSSIVLLFTYLFFFGSGVVVFYRKEMFPVFVILGIFLKLAAKRGTMLTEGQRERIHKGRGEGGEGGGTFGRPGRGMRK